MNEIGNMLDFGKGDAGMLVLELLDNMKDLDVVFK